MKEYTVREYDAMDIELLEEMSKEDVVSVLERIKRGWLPQNYICGTSEGKTYSEDEYDSTKLHAAMRLAIKELRTSYDRTPEFATVSTKKPALKVEKRRLPDGHDFWGKLNTVLITLLLIDTMSLYLSQRMTRHLWLKCCWMYKMNKKKQHN